MQRTHAIQLAESVRLERILERIEQIAQIGKNPQGEIARLAFTEDHRQARGLVIEWMQAAGLEVQISPIGNIFGRSRSEAEDAPVVMTGSHIDSVVRAGKLDGVLGVITALEAAQVIHDLGIALYYPLEVVCFAIEESARFSVGYAFGSKVMTGQPINDAMLLSRDREDRTTLAQAISKMRRKELGSGTETLAQDEALEIVQGYVRASRYPAERIKAFVELHIEQGPYLEQLHKPVGAVTTIAAPTRLSITFHGEQNHSGTTPMALRQDALVAAAETILAVERQCQAAEQVVGTVGVIESEPNSINTIPGKTRIGVDIRSTSADTKTAMVENVLEEIERIANKRGVAYDVTPLSEDLPQPLSEKVVSLIEKSCSALGIESHRMPSGAGHDAANLARVVKDTGMIFVPSLNGISHDPREWTDEQDILRGAQVLLLTLLELAQKEQ